MPKEESDSSGREGSGDPSQRDVPSGIGKRPQGAGSYFRKDENALHQDPPGDKVTVELSPYDLTRGRIILGKSKAEFNFLNNWVKSMKVRASVKKICDKCKIVKRKGVIR